MKINIKLSLTQVRDLIDMCSFGGHHIRHEEIPYSKSRSYVNEVREYKKQLKRIESLSDMLFKVLKDN